jgi:hypothetical protein
MSTLKWHHQIVVSTSADGLLAYRIVAYGSRYNDWNTGKALHRAFEQADPIQKWIQKITKQKVSFFSRFE